MTLQSKHMYFIFLIIVVALSSIASYYIFKNEIGSSTIKSVRMFVLFAAICGIGIILYLSKRP